MDFLRGRCKWVTASIGLRAAAAGLLACTVTLGGCTFFTDSENGDGLAYAADRGASKQVFPMNYRTELLAFLRSYLNDPTGVRSASLAEPTQKDVAGRQRYVACLRYSAKEFSGSYGPIKDRAVLYIDGRLDRLIEQPGDLCTGAAYAAFPEMEKLSR